MGNYSILLGWLMVLVIIGTSHEADTDMKAEITNYMYDVLNGMLEQAQSMTEPGCDMYKAKQCFLGMVNSTGTAILAKNMHLRDMACRDAHYLAHCVENSVSRCNMQKNMTNAGMRALEPYVPLMKAMINNVCSADKEGKSDDSSAEDSCKVDTVVQCLGGFFYVAAETYTQATCWQAKQTLACVSSAMKDCDNRAVKNMIGIVTSQIENTKRSTCREPGCHVELASECLMAAKTVAESNLGSVSNSPLLCGFMMSSLECVTENTINCPSAVYATISPGYYHLYESVKSVCKGMGGTMEGYEDAAHAIPLAAILDSQHISHDAVCPFYKSVINMLQYTPMNKLPSMDAIRSSVVASHIVGDYCREDKNDSTCEMMAQAQNDMTMCRPDYARMCIDHAKVPYLLSNVDVFGWDVICGEILKMVSCVEFTMSGCESKKIAEFEEKAKQFVSLVGDHCPNPVMWSIAPQCGRSSKCDIRGAIHNCMTPPTEAELTGGQACQNMNKTLMCVHKHTSGCMSITMLPVGFYLHHIMKKYQPYCYQPMPAYIKDEFSSQKLQECSYYFVGGMQEIMKKSKNFTIDMCGFIHMYLQNCSDVKMVPIIKVGLTKATYTVGAIVDTHCKVYEKELMARANKTWETSTIIEPQTCIVDNITAKIGTYWLALTVLPLTPLNHRKDICHDFEMLHEFVNSSAMTCSDERKQVLNGTMKVLYALHKSMCGDRMPMKPNNGCSVDMARHCFEKFSYHLVSSSFHHTQETCKGFVKVLHCVHRNTVNCSSNSELMSLRRDIRSIMSIVGESCSQRTEGMTDAMCGNLTELVANFPSLEPGCNTTDANACLQMFNDAEPLFIGKDMEHCSAAHKAILCAKTRIETCTVGDTNAAAVNQSITAIMIRVNNTCWPLYEKYMADRSRQCVKLPENRPICSVSSSCVPSVFNETTVAADVCTKTTARKACISLSLVGCDPTIFTHTQHGLKEVSKIFTAQTNTTCDLVPTALSTLEKSNFTQNLTCISGTDIFTNYLFNFTASERDLCDEYRKVADCIAANHTMMPVAFRAQMAKLSSTLKQMIHYRCELADIDLVYGDQTVDMAVFANIDPTCNFTQSAMCLGGYMSEGLTSSFYPLNQRYVPCMNQLSQLKCVYNHTRNCPASMKHKYLRIIDWVSGISESVGVCSMKPPKKCEPKEAVKCISHLGLGVTALNGTKMESCICAGIVPTQMCVQDKTSACEVSERLQVENTFKYITDQAMAMCSKKPEGHGDMCPAEEEKCQMDKAKECQSNLQHKILEVAKGGSMMEMDKQKKMCSEIFELEKCIGKSLSGCDDSPPNKMFRYNMPVLKTIVKTVCSPDKETGKEDKEMSKEAWMCGVTSLYCIKDYFHMVSLGSVTDLCGQVKATHACMKSAMKTCPKEHGKVVSIVTEQITMATKKMCDSDKCNPELAQTCLMEAGQLLGYGGNRMSTSPSVCSGVKMSLACVTRNTMSCDMEKHQVMKEHIKGVHYLVERMCAEEPQNRLLSEANSSMNELMSFAVLIGSRFVTKESICPTAKAMHAAVHEMAHYMEPKDVIEMKKKMMVAAAIIDDFCMEEEEITYMMRQPKPTCNMTMVLKCSESANLLQKMQNVYNYGWEPVCQSFEKMMCCLNHAGGGCHDEALMIAVMKVGRDAVDLVKDKCKMDEIIPRVAMKCPIPMKTCQLEEANRCMPEAYTYDALRPYCSDASKWIDCVKSYTTGCLAAQMAPLLSVVKYQTDICGYPYNPMDMIKDRDETSEATTCLYNHALTDLSSNLESSRNAYKTLCANKEVVYKCYNATKTKPALFKYFETDKVFGNWFNDMYCKNVSTQKDVTLPASEPSTCNAKMASVCFSSYLTTISHWMIVPLRDRPKICGDVWKTHQCIYMATSTCSEAKKSVYYQAMGILSIYQGNACPDMKNSMSAMMKQQAFCSLEIAEYILEEFGKYLSKASPYDGHMICHKLQYIMKYVYSSVKNCTTAQWEKLLPSLYSLKSLVGNHCPLLSAVTCDPARWNETVIHASCNKTKAMMCLKHFENASNTMTDMNSVCRMFYETSDCAVSNSLLCEPKDGMEINMTLHVMWSTVGKHCLEKGDPALMTPDTKALISEPCMSPPKCSVLYERCLNMSSMMSVCGTNQTVTRMCIEKQINGCSPEFQQHVKQSVQFYAGMMKMAYNMDCNIVPKIADSSVPQQHAGNCSMVLVTQMSQFMHNKSAGDMELCQVFVNVSKCLHHEVSTMSSLWKGLYTETLEKIHVETKYKCDIIGMMEKDKKEMMQNMSRESNTRMDAMNNTRNNNSMMMMNMTEPKACNLAMAESCLHSYVGFSLFGGMLPVTDRTYSCSQMKVMKKCVKDATLHCWSTTRYKFLQVTEWAQRIGDNIGVCTPAEYKAKCEPEKALECIGQLANGIAHHNKFMRPYMCSPIHPVSYCVASKTWGCPSHQRHYIERTLLDMNKIAMKICHHQEEKPDRNMADCMADERDDKGNMKSMCNVPEAVHCITSAHMKFMNSEEMDDVCSHLPGLRNCVRKNLQGCERCHKEGVHKMMEGLQKKISAKCPNMECDICGAMKCMETALGSMDMYQNNSMAMPVDRTTNKTSTMPTDKMIAMTCMDVMKVKECVGGKIKHCSNEEKEHVHMKVKKAMEMVKAPDMCKENIDVGHCLMGLEKVTNKILGLRSMPSVSDYIIAAKNSTTMRNTSEEMEKLMDKMRNNNCTSNEDGEKKEDLQMMCKKAWELWECVEKNMHQFSDSKGLIPKLLYIVKEGVMRRCYGEKKELKCFSCRGARSNGECNMEPLQTCNGKNQMCFTAMDEGLISKGCTMRIPLVHTSQCVNGTRGPKCVHFCDKTHCNMQEKRVVMDPPSCNMKAAMMCSVGLIKSMMERHEMHCGMTKEALYCIHMNTKDCMSESEGVISRMSGEMLLSPALIKCYAQPISCKCGHCAIVAYGNILQNPFIMMEDKLKLAAVAQKSILKSMMLDDCTMEDHARIYHSHQLANALIGDSMEMLKKNKTEGDNQKCNMALARSCMEVVPLEDMVRDARNEGMAEKICKATMKVMYCVHNYMSGCDMAKFTKEMNMTAQQVNVTLHRKLEMVGRICNVTKMVKTMRMMENGTSLQEQMSHMFEGVSQMISAVVKDSEAENAYRKMSELMSGEVKPRPRCKVSLALNHCFAYLKGVVPKDKEYCGLANKTYHCLMFMTEGCYMIQKAPVLYLIHKLVSIDPTVPPCSFLKMNYSEKEIAEWSKEDPTVHLSMATMQYVDSIYKAYTQPSMNSTYMICHAAVEMDNNIYMMNLPPVGRLFQKDMAMLTTGARDIACMEAFKTAMVANADSMNCSSDDVMCQTIKNMAQNAPTNTAMQQESATCRVTEAALCLSSYMMRFLSSSFVPLAEHPNLCWEEKAMETCVVSATSKCSPTLQTYFNMTMESIHNSTYPICSRITDLREPKCSAAEQCLMSLGYNTFRPLSNYSMEYVKDICMQTKAVAHCIKHHSYNCSAEELKRIKEGVMIMGNVTDLMCPEVSKQMCALTTLKPRDVRRPCMEDNLRMCVDTLSNEMMTGKYNKDQLCQKLEDAVRCVNLNSSNCNTYFVDEIYEMVHLTAKAGNLTCPSVQKMAEEMMPSCKPIPGCMMSNTLYNISNIFEAALTGTLQVDVCSALQTLISGINNEGCSSLQISIFNVALNLGQQFLGRSCNIQFPVTTSYKIPVADNLAKCVQSYAVNVTKAINGPVYGFYDICEVAKDMGACLSKELVYSNIPEVMIHSLVLNGTANQIREFVDKMCVFKDIAKAPKLNLVTESSQCRANIASACVTSFATRAVFAGAFNSYDRSSLCHNDIMYTRGCIAGWTTQCSSTVMAQLKTIQHLHESLLMESGYCPENVVTGWKEEMAMMMGEKLSNYEMVVKLMGSKAMGTADMEQMKMAEDEKAPAEMAHAEMKKTNMMGMMDMECQPWKIGQCLVDLVYSLNGHMSNGTMMKHSERNQFCYGLSREVQSCSDKYMQNCDDTMKHMMFHLASPLLSMAARHCGDQSNLTEERIASMIGAKYEIKKSSEEQGSGYKDMPETEQIMKSDSDKMKEKERMRSMVKEMFEKSDDRETMSMFVKHLAQFSMFGDNRKVDGMSNDEMEKIQKMFEMKDSDNKKCVDPMKVPADDKCNYMKAVACIQAVENEILDTSSTKERLCLKHAVAVRCAISATKKCDHKSFTSMVLKEAFENMMKRIKHGHDCPTYVKTPCYREGEMCKIKEVPECLAKLQEYVMDASKQTDGLPAYKHVCTMLPKVWSCLEEKSNHCPRTMAAQMYERMDSGLGLLQKMCRKMPKFACVSSLVWKTAGIMVATEEIGTMGAHAQALKYFIDMYERNMTDDMKPTTAAPATTIPKRQRRQVTTTVTEKPKETMYNADKEEKKLFVLGLMKKMIDDPMKQNCNMGDDEMKDGRDMMDMDKEDTFDFLKGMLDVFRYIQMDSKMIKEDEMFKHKMQLQLFKLGKMRDMKNYDILGIIMKHVVGMETDDNKNMTWYGNMTMNRNSTMENKTESLMNMMKMDFPMLMSTVLKQVITMEDSEKLLKYVFHQMTTAKLDKMMKEFKDKDTKRMDDEMKEDMMKLGEKIEESSEEMMSRDKKMGDHLKEGMAMMMREIVKGHMEYLENSHDNKKVMEILHKYMEMKMKQKKAMCMELWEASKCAKSVMEHVPSKMRGFVNMTLHIITEVGKEYCQPQKCYSCEGVTDNEKCNKQGQRSCKDGQVCYTRVVDGRVNKGCSYGFEVDMKKNTGEWCYGEDCNKPKYGVKKEPEMCKPMEALQCVFGMLPVIMKEGPLDSRTVYKHLWCIEHHTKACTQETNKKMKSLGDKMKHMLMDGQCSGQKSEYVCGVRSVMSLASTVVNPGSDRKAICWQLNETISMLQMAAHHNKCSEYEMIEAHNSIGLIYSVIGYDYCPMIKVDRSICNASKMADSKEMTCDLNGIQQCTRGLELVGKLEEMGMTGGMSHGGYDLRDMNYFCKLVEETMNCIGMKTGKCSQKEKDSVHKMLEPHLGPVLKHCPSIKMYTDMCYPEMEMPRCEVGTAIMTCFKPMKYDQQSLTAFCPRMKDEFNSTLMCLHKHKSGCNSVQGAPLYMLVHQTALHGMFLCGGNQLLNNSAVVNDMYQRITSDVKLTADQRALVDMLMTSLMKHVMDMPKLNSDKYPVMSLLSKAIHMRMEMKGMNQVNKSMMADMIDGTNKMLMKMYALESKMNTDETYGLAVCLLKATTHMSRALMYPGLFKMTVCEINWATVQCMRDLELSPSGMMISMGTMDSIAMETEQHCKSYMEDKIQMGMKLANATKDVISKLRDPTMNKMNLMNMTDEQLMKLMNQTEFRNAMGSMVQGDPNCDTWNISQHLSFTSLRIMTGGFNKYSEWPGICWGLKHMKESIMPEIMKCSKENQEIYKAVLGNFEKSMGPVCYQPEMNMTKPTCSVEMAGACLTPLINMYSVVATPTDRFCRQLRSSMLCMKVHMMPCGDAQKIEINGVWDYVRSIVGDRCPLIMAATTCNVDANAAAKLICNVTQAKHCGMDVMKLYETSRDVNTVCSKLPDVFQCIEYNMSSCSQGEITDGLSHVDLIFDKIINMCYRANYNPFNTKCPAPAKCSVGGAVRCMAGYASIKNVQCSDIENIMNCVQAESGGCNFVQQQIVTAMVSATLNGRAPAICPVYQDTSYRIVGMEFTKTSQCRRDFNQSFVEALVDTKSAAEKACVAIGKFYDCMGKTSEAAPLVQYGFLGHTYGLTGETFKAVCMSMMKPAMTIMPKMTDSKVDKSCNVPQAAQCMTIYTLTTVLAGTMSHEDKKSFCEMKGPSEHLLNCTMTSLNKCPNTTIEPFHALGAILHSSIEFSHLCTEEYLTCSPKDAMYCGEKMKMTDDMMMSPMDRNSTRMTSNSTQMTKAPMCSHLDETLECLNRNTYGCREEVHAGVRKGMETGYCLSFDLLSGCLRDKMREKEMAAQIPHCHGDRKWDWTKANCNLTLANHCVLDLYKHLKSPFKDCNLMHGAYVRAMECYGYHTMTCDSATKMVTDIVIKKAAEKIYDICPNIVSKPCIEPEECERDEAEHCIHAMEYMKNYTFMSQQDKCMISDLTQLCILEKTKHCSSFGKAYVSGYMEGIMAKSNFTCQHDFKHCMNGVMTNALGIVNGDVMVARISHQWENTKLDMTAKLMKDKTTDWMNLPMTMATYFDNDRMKVMQDLRSKVIETMTTGAGSMMVRDNGKRMSTENMTSLAEGVKYMLGIVLGGEDDFLMVHAKLKTIECLSFKDSMKCVQQHLAMSNESAEMIGLVNSTLMRIGHVVDDMCTAETSCTDMEDLTTCNMPEALAVTVKQMMKLMSHNMTGFCSGLTKAAADLRNAYGGCVGKVREHFDAIRQVMRGTGLALCGQSPCESAEAEQCIAAYRSSQTASCSDYETALACVTAKLTSCNSTVSSKLKGQLEEIHKQKALNCEKLPTFKMSSLKSIQMFEGGPAKSIELSLEDMPSTLCKNKDNCYITVRAELQQMTTKVPGCSGTQKMIPQLMVQQDVQNPCQLRFTDDNFSLTQKIPLVATVDNRYDGTQKVMVKMIAEKYDGGQKVLSRQIANYTVSITDTDSWAMCSAYGDPNIITFDGLSHVFSYERESVLYRHTTMPFEVRIFTQKCGSDKSRCICAVMVKSVDDVYVVDICRRRSDNPARVRTPVTRLYQKGPLTSGTQLYRSKSGKIKMIVLPTGTTVFIKYNAKILSAYVVPSALDWEHTEGLCGYYDRSTHNDFMMSDGSLLSADKIPQNGQTPKSFGRTWRTSDSLFKGTSADNSFKLPTYCTCSADPNAIPDKCDTMKIVETCDLYKGVVPMNLTPEDSSSSSGRKKRQTFDPTADLVGDVTDPEVLQEVVTLQVAVATCNQILNSQKVQDCLKVTNINITPINDSCVTSVRYFNNTEGTMTAIDTSCENEISKNETNLSSDPAAATIVTEIEKLSCENDCSGNGICQAGSVCQCFQNWVGPDCSIGENDPPLVTSLQNAGLCNNVDSSCTEVFVYGSKFTDSLNKLTCKYQPLTIDGSGTPKETGTVTTQPATYISSEEVKCPIPAGSATLKAMYITVSNNDVQYSSKMIYVSSNPGCYDCSTTAKTCNPTTTGCDIGGVCYSAGASNPSDTCIICHPTSSTSDWTRLGHANCLTGSVTTAQPKSTTTPRPDPTTTPRPGQPTAAPVTDKPANDQEQQTIIIALGVVAGILFLIVLCLAVKICTQPRRVKKDWSNILDDSQKSTMTTSDKNDGLAFHSPTYDEKPELVVDPNTSYVHGTVPARVDTSPKDGPTTLTKSEDITP